MADGRERLDLLLVERGHFTTREKAKAAIMAGLVTVDGELADKPGTRLARSADIAVKGKPHPYVSRGGLKLEKAISEFMLDVNGKIVIDIGSSTGGFTDCALQHGAAFVYAVDAGTNQLDWKLRQSPKVRVMEKTNFRYFEPDDLSGPKPQLATIDVSFISLTLIFPPLDRLLEPGAAVVALIKPQFEAGRERVGKAGIVRDPEVHRGVLKEVLGFAAGLGWRSTGLTFSPVTGGDGNIEFLACWEKSGQSERLPTDDGQIGRVVEEAAALLNGL